MPPAAGVGGEGKDAQALGRESKALPFEFRALEVCLEFACKSLEQEVQSMACCPVSGQIAALNYCSVVDFILFQKLVRFFRLVHWRRRRTRLWTS